MTTSVALADSAGAPAGARSVIVPSAAATASTDPTPAPSVAAPIPQAPLQEPETVPAPEPEDIASSVDSQASAGEPSAASEEQLVAEIEQSGSLDAAYEWAQQHGWQRARIEAWIARLEAKVAEKRAKGESAGQLKSDDSAGKRTAPHLPAEAGTPSGRDLSGSSSGSKREQSRVPPG
jgi:hypothetical protein